jgi:hypothetical protein
MSAQAIARTVCLLADFGSPASCPASALSISAALPLQSQTDVVVDVRDPATMLKEAGN